MLRSIVHLRFGEDNVVSRHETVHRLLFNYIKGMTVLYHLDELDACFVIEYELNPVARKPRNSHLNWLACLVDVEIAD